MHIVLSIHICSNTAPDIGVVIIYLSSQKRNKRWQWGNVLGIPCHWCYLHRPSSWSSSPSAIIVIGPKEKWWLNSGGGGSGEAWFLNLTNLLAGGGRSKEDNLTMSMSLHMVLKPTTQNSLWANHELAHGVKTHHQNSLGAYHKVVEYIYRLIIEPELRKSMFGRRACTTSI